jgi:hypothetical protein
MNITFHNFIGIDFLSVLFVIMQKDWESLIGRDEGGNVNNVQYKINYNCYYEFPHV